jgi:3-oxoacyl-[acyl-carrier protein] reductase
VEHVWADLGDAAAPHRVMSMARDAFGHVDVLVANHARSSQQSLFALTAAELDTSFAVNARATLLLVQHFAEHHRDGVAGRVVLFTSGRYHGAMPQELPYIASKAVVQQLTRRSRSRWHRAASRSTASTLDPMTPGTRSVTSVMTSRAPCRVVDGVDRRTPPDW